MAIIAQSLSLFVLAGLCEIGGGYLVWLWLREGKGLLIGVLGAVVLILYWHYSDVSTVPFRARLRSLRRDLCRSLYHLGLV